jgi:hypothetical protein
LFTSAKSPCSTENIFQNRNAMITPVSKRQVRSRFLFLNQEPEFVIRYLDFERVIKMESLNLPDITESLNATTYCTGIRQLIKRTRLNVILFF